MAAGTAELTAAGDADDYGRIGALTAEQYANNPPGRVLKDAVIGPYGVTAVEDPGATEVRIQDVSRAPRRVGISAIAGLRRSELIPRIPQIVLGYQEPRPLGNGDYGFSDGTPNIVVNQPGTPSTTGDFPTVI